MKNKDLPKLRRRSFYVQKKEKTKDNEMVHIKKKNVNLKQSQLVEE